MNQKEFIKLVVDVAAKREIKISQAVVKELLEVIEESLDLAILDGKTVKVFGCKFERRKKETETTGKVKQKDGSEIEWTKAPHTYPAVKYLKSKKDELTREI